MNANGISDITFRFISERPDGTNEQREVSIDALFVAWLDALNVLRIHGLDHKLPKRTLDAMGYTPARVV